MYITNICWYILCAGLHLLRGNLLFTMWCIFFISDVIVSHKYKESKFRIHLIKPKTFMSKYCLTSFLSSPDTTLSRYDISCMASYVSLPSCLFSTCRISALSLRWISGCSASSYSAKLKVLAEVSKPANRNDNACETNKSPSISEKAEIGLVKISHHAMSSSYVKVFLRSSLFIWFTIHCVLRK